MKGLGNGGVTTDGLVFVVDSFNKKSYIPPISSITESNVTGSSYSGFAMTRTYDSSQQPITWSIPGDVQSTWQNNISNSGGSITLNLSGGSTPETYTVSNAAYDVYNNVTILYPNLTANYVTMSHTMSLDPVNNYTVKVSGKNLQTIFDIYLQQGSLTLGLTGGLYGTNIFTFSNATYSAASMIRQYDGSEQPVFIAFPGYLVSQWDKLRLNSGGSLTMSLSGVSPEIYNVTSVLYDTSYGYTLLTNGYSGGSVTMSGTCSIDFVPGGGPYGPFTAIKIANRDMYYLLNELYMSQPGYNPLYFNLSGGATPETYMVSQYYIYFDGFDSYLYNASFGSASYSDHTQFEVLVPEMLGLQYPGNTIATYSLTEHPETYIVPQYGVFYDGTDTYINDDMYDGSVYTTHTQFDVLVPQMIGTEYYDNNNASYSYTNIIAQTDVFNLKDSVSNTLNTLQNNVYFNSRDFVFDGVDDYINVGSLGNFTSYTLDMWFKSTAVVDYKNLIDFNGNNDGVRIEQYTTPGYTLNWTNLGYTGTARMSITLDASGGFGIGGDCIGDIVENEWYNLVISYKTSPAIAVPLTNVFTYDGYGQYWSQGYGPYVAAIVGADPSVALQWNTYIAAAGGVLDTTAFQSFGTHSVTYSITGAYYQPPANPNEQGVTYFIGFDVNNFETQPWDVTVDTTYLGFNSLITGSYSSVRYYQFQEMISVATSLTFSLVSGTYSENYVIDSITNDGVNMYLYDSSNIGTTYNIYTQSTVLLPVPFSLGWLFGTPSIPSGPEGNGYDRITATAFGNVCSVYLNNDKIIDQWIWSGNFIGYINNMRIGDGYDYSSRRFQGSIPYVAIYDRSLSDSEVDHNYNSLKWRFTN